jgi:predicted TIM-barrel fold metal-dependent hydrolase
MLRPASGGQHLAGEIFNRMADVKITGLRHLVAQVGASQIMLGSDTPVPWEQHPVDHVFATKTLNNRERAAILGGNAAKLFGLEQT